jgi:8-oxo-dGTP pyrophosphatase MutT (NUDIX family)
MAAGDGQLVRAAGAVVWRLASSEVEVLLVHRPRYDDWSFPKGKCDAGESFADAARREVAEETGYEVELGEALGDVRYRDLKDRPKVVRYWAATVRSGQFTANDEVDQIRWVSVAGAEALVSYEHDRSLLARLPSVT